MGLGDLNPQSVRWTGSEFVALTRRGVAQYGLLELSNSVPRRLLVARKKGDSPFKTISYVYPESQLSFSGFPEKIIISTLLDGQLQPFLELNFSRVDVAKQPISADTFAPDRFITSDIRYTNIYSHDTFTSISPRGQATVPLAAITGSGTNWRHWVIYLLLALLVVPAAISLKTLRLKRSKQTK
jgi:hypothetical protein